ncbi:hypothetical protein EP7_001544 [Isosphaeraceae bacterium EP7]
MTPRGTIGRPAMIAVPAMVCLVLTLMLAASLLRTGLAAREVTREAERRLQADWLAEAGLERASARLAASEDYRGETWTLSPEDMGGADAGRVTIAIEEAGDRPGLTLAKVVAEFPAGGASVARSSRSVRMERVKRDDEGGAP